jgi:peptidyl-prolyl cis-trans isomerase B (cyclophilin B)
MTDTRVVVETNLGNFTIALDAQKAPKSVKNFLAYVDSGHYAGTIFHRVIKGFMVQGGGFDAEYNKKATLPPVENEAFNGLKNTRGTVAMARTSDPHSATAQTDTGWGYTVFGSVVEGMDVVDKIRAVRTGSGGPFPKDAPQTPVVLTAVRRA